MAAVLLALASAVLFGALAIAIRLATRRGADPETGALATTAIALVACGSAALVIGSSETDHLWPFLLAGMIAPGASQILFFRAVRDIGPARTTVLVGTAPVVAAVIAIVALEEPLRAALVIATVLIVSGGVALAGERVRPDSFRRIGVVLALAASALFATRDNVIRELQVDSDVEPLAGAAATLVGGGVVIVAYLLMARRARILEGIALHVWLPSGLLFAASYAALFEAYDRGRVTVVSPLVATESLWGVVFAALVLRRSELIGGRLVVGALLIVAGSALIGGTR
jgi:drug/metabolite transporter (DMT)-like permease